MNSLRKVYKQFAYRQETFYVLNYLTLSVKDDEIKREVNEYRRSQLNRVAVLLILFSVL